MIKYGDDCSGISAPAQALKNLGVNFEYLFASDIDKYARMSLKENHNPKIIYEDMTKDRELPKLDIYTAGFPCQPFSTAGLRKGTMDKRGNIFFHCIEVIKQTEPNLFILENVTGIMTIHGGEYYKQMKEVLSELNEYNVQYFVLNTKDYGIPQNRKRLFIIGTRGKLLNIPEKVPMKNINDYIDYSNTEKREYIERIMKKYECFKDATFANVDIIRLGDKVKKNLNYCPTITAGGYLWNVKLQRIATIKEYLMLQGFPEDFKQVVSKSQLKKQLGNSISVNVLEAIFKEYFTRSNK